MSIPTRPLALFVLAATPVANAAAAVAVVPPALGLPSFDCNAAAAGATINWSDGLSITPMLGFGATPDSALNFLPLPCSDGTIGDSLDHKRKGDGNLDYLKIEMKEVFISSLVPGGSDGTDFGYKEQFEQVLADDGQLKFRSFWDVTLNFHKTDDAGKILPGDYKEFIGIEIDSPLKFVNDALPEIREWHAPFRSVEPERDDKPVCSSANSGTRHPGAPGHRPAGDRRSEASPLRLVSSAQVDARPDRRRIERRRIRQAPGLPCPLRPNTTRSATPGNSIRSRRPIGWRRSQLCTASFRNRSIRVGFWNWGAAMAATSFRSPTVFRRARLSAWTCHARRSSTATASSPRSS